MNNEFNAYIKKISSSYMKFSSYIFKEIFKRKISIVKENFFYFYYLFCKQ